MKREYLAIAIGSLLVLAPSALAQQLVTADGNFTPYSDEPIHYVPFVPLSFKPVTTIAPANLAQAAVSAPVTQTNSSGPDLSKYQVRYRGNLTVSAPAAQAAPADADVTDADAGSAPAPAPVKAKLSVGQDAMGFQTFQAPNYNPSSSSSAAQLLSSGSSPSDPSGGAALAPAPVTPAFESGKDCGDSCDEFEAQRAKVSAQAAASPPANVQVADPSQLDPSQQASGLSSDPVVAIRQVENGVQFPEQQAPSSCVEDKKGTEGLIEKGLSRTRKINNIWTEMDARSGDVNDAPAGSVNALKKKDATLPTNLEAKAKCIMIIPDETSGGFGGAELEYGAGAYKCRDASGNFEPNYHYVQLKGANFGFQLGGKLTDRTFFFMNDSAQAKLQDLDHNHLKVGARAGIAVGPYGRDASISTGFDFHDDIRTYSQSKGLYVGVSLEGAVLHRDRNMDAVMNDGDSVTKHKHNWLGFIHFGHRNICAYSSDQVAANPPQATQPVVSAPAPAAPAAANSAVTPAAAPAPAPAVDCYSTN
jgi:lipid-binding SYLF domain-containing protein